MDRYEEMWTVERREWVVVCDSSYDVSRCRGVLFFHTPTSATRIIEDENEAIRVALILRDRGAEVTDDHPTLGKPKPAPAKVSWMRRALGRVWPGG